ncbi:ROK family transcriptional regulator [Paenibacillus sp. GD4]|uniref:ROK family transcriptional regulator n=1 Tax=Paenibacillus sp. GD4 TaxID=3068890 RepID=UPI0027969F98|nr:ROK family transcriptional regulator [Paenibacillus sp. GD4]MDQ1910260.1 ROK family transcriptional regulator [Paenibacillus sp. GD4]
MKQTGDLTLVKRMNKSIVLNHIRFDSPISRARIAELTGLTKATVSSLVAEWIESGLVREIGEGASSGGRKPVMLVFDATAGYVVGVDLGTDYVLAVLTDLNGNVVEESRSKHENESVDAVIGAVKAGIREVAGRVPDCRYGVVGIGIGIPGISDEEGNVLFAPNLGWENVPLQQRIEEEFGLPVVIENEANAGAVGEQRFGAAQDSSFLVYVSIGSGIGTGILIKGELFRGSTGFSGELGHVTIEHNGKPCRCGNAGCWELYASEKALVEDARNAIPGVKVDALLQLASDGEPAAIEAFGRLGRYLGIGMVNIINGFNPESIVIGGRLATAEAWLKEPIREVIESRSLPYPRASLKVQFSSLGMRSTVLGVCSLSISRFFAGATAE